MYITSGIPDRQSVSYRGGRKTAALGCFDGIHIGHVSVINAAKREDAALCVLSVGKPFMVHGIATRMVPECEEENTLAQLGVDIFVRTDFEKLRGMSGEEFVGEILASRLGVSLVSCGADFRFGKGAACGTRELSEFAEKYGIECVICPQVEADGRKISSTWLRELLDEGNIRQLNKLLGRRYGYAVPVTTGMHLARRLGAPTINQPLPGNLYPLRKGVYASQTLLSGLWHYSVTNIGVKPTVDGSERRSPLSETWIPEFSGDLYGETVRVELLDFIRDERRFDSLDELGETIQMNARTARGIWEELSGDINLAKR